MKQGSEGQAQSGAVRDALQQGGGERRAIMGMETAACKRERQQVLSLLRSWGLRRKGNSAGPLVGPVLAVAPGASLHEARRHTQDGMPLGTAARPVAATWGSWAECVLTNCYHRILGMGHIMGTSLPQHANSVQRC